LLEQSISEKGLRYHKGPAQKESGHPKGKGTRIRIEVRKRNAVEKLFLP
jgi:hypothetical protein